MNSSTDTNQDKSEFIANLSFLRQAHLFSSLPQEALKLFAYLSTRESYRQGDYIFRTGDDDGCSYYIIEGNADLVLDNGDKSSVVRNYPQDHFLGGLSMFAPLPRLFSLRAATDLTVIVMTRKKFSMVMEKFPELSLQIVKVIAKKINEVEGQSIERYKKETASIKDFLGTSLI